MNDVHELVVTRAEIDELPAIRALIVEGLEERWTKYEPGFNPDLESFNEHYAHAVVQVAKLNGRIIGCGILVNENPETGRIVRMSVARAHRRTGVGGKVLEALLVAARDLKFNTVVAETTATWESAANFYPANGFTPTHLENGDQHFMLRLE